MKKNLRSNEKNGYDFLRLCAKLIDSTNETAERKLCHGGGVVQSATVKLGTLSPAGGVPDRSLQVTPEGTCSIAERIKIDALAGEKKKAGHASQAALVRNR